MSNPSHTPKERKKRNRKGTVSVTVKITPPKKRKTKGKK